MTDDRDAITRRNALKSGTALVGVVGATGLLPERVRAETTVSGGGDELQNAIDAASGGDTLVVTDSLTYNPITVDVSVTIETTANPKIRGTGGTSAAVSIATDGVTIDGFDVRNPDGLLGIKVQQGYDNATITNNEVKNVGPTGRLGVTGIIVGQGDHDGIEIENNEIRNLDQETTDDSGFPTVNGILFDANNASPGTVSDTVVNSNTIQDVESDIAPLGIVVQHGTDGVDINNNEIRDLVAADDTDSDQSDSTGDGPDDDTDPESDVDPGFTFAQGINIASPSTSDTDVRGNEIRDVTSEELIYGEAVKIDGDGGGVTFRQNVFDAVVGLNNRNGTKGPSDAPVVDAEDNWWGSADGPEEADFNQDADGDDRADVIGNVTYEPFLEKPPSANRGNGKGNGNGN